MPIRQYIEEGMKASVFMLMVEDHNNVFSSNNKHLSLRHVKKPNTLYI